MNSLPVIFAIVSVVFCFATLIIYMKTKKLLKERTHEDFLKLLKKYYDEVSAMHSVSQDIINELSKIGKMSANGYQKIGFLRYNPFDDTGGNQSFSLCLLNAYNSGCILSSLHGREGTRIYAKEIARGTPLQKLSDEERYVFDMAKQSVNTDSIHGLSDHVDM